MNSTYKQIAQYKQILYFTYYLCVQTPFTIESNEFVRRLISKLEVPCPECGAPIPRGDLLNHQKQFCSKRKAAESSGANDLQKATSPAATASQSMATGEQQVENAIGVTRGKLSSSKFELASKAKSHDWKSQSQNLRGFVANLKCAQIDKFDFLLEIFTCIEACLPLESKQSNSLMSCDEIFEFLNVSIDALRDTLVQLRSSPPSDFFSKDQVIALPKAAAFDLSVKLRAQSQRAEEMLSSLQYLLQRLLTNHEEVKMDSETSLSSLPEVVQMTRTLFEELAGLANVSKIESNRAMLIAQMTDKLEKYQQRFTPAVVRQTRDFKSVLAKALECKLISSSNDIAETPNKELIRQELESLCDLQRALTNLNVLLIHSLSNDSSPLAISQTSPTGFESATGILEECQRAIVIIASLIFQLNSTMCNECPKLRSLLGETNTADIEKVVYQVILELREKLGNIARSVIKDCTIERFLKDVANAIFDCYNSITDKVFKYVGSVKEEQELNKKLDEVRSQLLDIQQQKLLQENLVRERDTKIAELQQHFDEVRNQLFNVQKQTTFQQNSAQERDSKIAETQSDSGSTRANVDEEQYKLNWERANELALRAACELQMSNGDSVAGSLYEARSGEQVRHLFVTTNRRLLVKSPADLCNAQLLLNVLTEDGRLCVPLSRNRVCDVWNTRSRGEHSGNTVVELSAEAASDCKLRGANFLKIGEAHTGEEVRLKSFLLADVQIPVLLYIRIVISTVYVTFCRIRALLLAIGCTRTSIVQSTFILVR